jgi:hypothetical protein
VSSSFLDSLIDARLDDALIAAENGRPLIVRARRRDTPNRLYARASQGPAMFDTVTIATGEGRTPQEALLEAVRDITSGIVDLGELCRSSYLNLKLFVADLRNLKAEPWLTLAGTFAALRAGEDDGPILALITDGATIPQGCDYLDDGDFFSPAEAAVLAREYRSSPSLLQECGDAAAIEVSRGDLDQLKKMLQLPDQDRFDPTAWVRRQPLAESQLIWRGEEEICSTWLAVNNPKRLARRVWRGQVTILLPWLAEALGSFLDAHARRLPRDLKDSFTSEFILPEEFEWSNILYVLNSIKAKREADCAYRMRRMRNALAHQQALTWDEARQAEGDLKTLLAWR